jgi:hypothetical protein
MQTTDANSTSRSNFLKEEIKRVSNTTLRGNFTNPEDKTYWEVKLKKMNSELSAIEEIQIKNRKAK